MGEQLMIKWQDIEYNLKNPTSYQDLRENVASLADTWKHKDYDWYECIVLGWA